MGILILLMIVCLLWLANIKDPYEHGGRLTIIPLALAALPAVFQVGKGIAQRGQARKLQESTFVPRETLENRDLAAQQAYSRRAPGQAAAEENIRRTQANQINAGTRAFGGDVNKMAAIASNATGQADDANRSVAAQGQAFSEGAFNRLQSANNSVAIQRQRNRDEYNQAKASLLAASDQNIFGGINNLATAGLVGALNKNGSSGNPWGSFLQSKFTPPAYGSRRQADTVDMTDDGYGNYYVPNMSVPARVRTR